MAETEAPRLRSSFQQNSGNNSVPSRPTSGTTRQYTSPRMGSVPNTPDQERSTDPLSAHIIARTQSIAEGGESPSFRRGLSELVNIKEKSRENLNEPSHLYEADRKERKKRVSFFAKLRGKDTGEDDDRLDSTDELARAEGTHTSAFCARHRAEKPTYIRVRSNNKPNREFDNLFLAQELFSEDTSTENAAIGPTETSSNAVWSMKFSKDGRFLATGGQDMVVRVWRVLASAKDRDRLDSEEDSSESNLNAPVFSVKPHREYRGHTADVLDLSWSKNNFLLSSSMDKTVRLWHVSRDECLCCFQHSDFVTSIAFHPRDDKFFISGSLDCKLRLWNIHEKKVANWNELPELITAVAFDPTGRMAIAGSFTGLCLFYETDGLRYHTQIHVKSSRGRNSQGSKITGIQAVSLHPDNPHGEVKLLITSNDSRIRLYNMRDKSLEAKFKGNDNKCSQIRASFSDDLNYVICGSEDRQVYIWNAKSFAGNKDKKPFEHFESHPNIVTATAFAPNNARELLAASGDPVYDIVANFPQRKVSAGHSIASHDPSLDSTTQSPSDGQIIVCADYSGTIKVFRQDSAANLRNKAAAERTDSASIPSSVPLRKSSIRSHHTNGDSSTRPASVVSQESLSIVRKPHECVIPSSPARARTGTASSHATSINNNTTTPNPTIHVNGSPLRGDVTHVPPRRTSSPSLAPATEGRPMARLFQPAGQSNAATRSGSPLRGSDAKNESRSVSARHDQHRKDHHSSNHYHHHQHDQSHRERSPMRNDSPRSSSDHHNKPESYTYMGEGGVSFEYYDIDGSTHPSPSRPSNMRMESTQSWSDMGAGAVIQCERCGGGSFAATSVRGEMRLTCQNCLAVVR